MSSGTPPVGLTKSPKGRKSQSNSESERKDKRISNNDDARANLVLRERNGPISRTFWTDESGNTARTSNALLNRSWSLKQLLYEIFLPEGFPESVSEDYVMYQVFDSIQALASSFTGTLCTKAILTGAGVGDSTATATAATLNWIIKDGSGMIGRIAFTWLQGSNLDANAKTWRFMADILNDLAMTLEICIPMVPHLFLPLICTGSVLKAIVGAAGGATRAALTQHQARRDNMADVASKDGSQETALVLVGMMLSLILNPIIGDSQTLTWIFFAIFTFIHLLANYTAVSVVAIDKLNRQRADILIDHFLNSGMSEVMTPAEVSRFESILHFETDRTLELGCSVETALAYAEPGTTVFDFIREIHNSGDKYLLLQRGTKVAVLYDAEATSKTILQSYLQARFLQKGYSTRHMAKRADHFTSLMVQAGWNAKANFLVPSQRRVSVRSRQ